MGLYDKEVKAAIGKIAWDILRESVRKGEVNGPQMKDIAQQLSPNVLGDHLQRISGQAGAEKPNWYSMREILSCWYQVEPCTFEDSKMEALNKLVSVFGSNEVGLCSVANQLRHCLPGQSSAGFGACLGTEESGTPTGKGLITSGTQQLSDDGTSARHPGWEKDKKRVYSSKVNLPCPKSTSRKRDSLHKIRTTIIGTTRSPEVLAQLKKHLIAIQMLDGFNVREIHQSFEELPWASLELEPADIMKGSTILHYGLIPKQTPTSEEEMRTFDLMELLYQTLVENLRFFPFPTSNLSEAER